MIMLVELLMTGAAMVLPILAVVAILEGKRMAAIVLLLTASLAVFLLGFGVGFHSQAREASRRFHAQIGQPLRVMIQHMQLLSAHGKTTDLDRVLSVLGEHDYRLFPDTGDPQPGFPEVVRALIEEEVTSDANNTSEGIHQPADGLPKPSM